MWKVDYADGTDDDGDGNRLWIQSATANQPVSFILLMAYTMNVVLSDNNVIQMIVLERCLNINKDETMMS